MLNGGGKVGSYMGLSGGGPVGGCGGPPCGVGSSAREQRRPMWTQHEKAVLRLLMREYAGVTEYDPPDIHKHPIKNEMWRLLTTRYNDHPNVRTRDTKQLRKAWENLKYRARKLGGDLKKAGGAAESLDSSWPLEGIELSLGGRETSASNREGFEDDSKFMSLEQDIKRGGRPWIREEDELEVEDSSTGRKLESPEGPRDKVSSTSVPPSGGFGDCPPSRYGPPFSGDFFLSGGRGAVLNLQPLVTSLVGGALPALLPFLNPASAPSMSSDLLLHNPFLSSFFRPPPPEEDTRSEASCSKEDEDDFCESSPPSVARPLLTGLLEAGWSPSQSCSKVNSEAAPLPSIRKAMSCDPLKREEPSSPSSDVCDSPPDGESSDLFLLQQKVSDLMATRSCEQKEHSATLQCLNLQMAHAEAQHKIKVKILETQLRFWRTKLQLLREVSASTSSRLQEEEEVEEDKGQRSFHSVVEDDDERAFLS